MAGFFQDLFVGRPGKTTQTPIIDPAQQQAEQGLASFLTSRIGRGLPSYQGQFTAGISPYEQTGLDRLQSFTSAPTPSAYGEASGTLSRLQNPNVSPEELSRVFEAGVGTPARSRFQSETLPQIRESFIGSGNFFGSERAAAEAKASRDLNESLTGQKTQFEFGAEQAAQDRALKAAAFAPGAASAGAADPLARAQAGLQFGSLPRQLQQQELTSRLQEFVRTQPELSPIIADVMSFLGLSTVSTDIGAPTSGIFGTGGHVDPMKVIRGGADVVAAPFTGGASLADLGAMAGGSGGGLGGKSGGANALMQQLMQMFGSGGGF